MKLFRLISFALAGSCFLGSCSDFSDDNPDTSDAILFGVSRNSTLPLSQSRSESVGRLIATSADCDSLWLMITTAPSATSVADSSRGSQLSSSSIKSFAVSCLTTFDGTTKSYFQSELYSGSINSGWTNDAGRVYYWMPENATFDFYAWTPAGAPVFTDQLASSFNYTVPQNAAEQSDLCVSYNPSATPNIPVPLAFKHVLSAVAIRQGNGMRAGTIKSVKFKNLKGRANYSFKTGNWTPESQTGDFSLEGNFPTNDGSSLTGSDKIMFMLPQDLTASQVEITLDYNGETKTYSTSLSGNWEMGQSYTYTITINPEFKFETTARFIDAHYERFAVSVTPDAVNDDTGWQLASDVEGVTFLSDYDYQSKQEYSLLRDGFWTDRIFENNAVVGSARGESVINFIGNQPQKIWVFVPENTATTNRAISLKAKAAGANVTVVFTDVVQYAAFGDNDGWEQTADSNEGSFGFCWDLKVSYQLPYSSDLSFGQNRETYCNNLIESNSAENYAIAQRFRYTIGQYRYCITLDYSKLSDLNVATSTTDGLANTIALYNFGKGASTASFETVLLSSKKFEQGHQSEDLFRKMVQSDLYSGNWADFANNGTPVTGSDAVGSILKKNRYDIVKVASGNIVSYTALLSENDIVWYLPAVNEFTSAPTTVAEPINKNGWSSTAVAGKTNSYLGNSVSTNRKTLAAIRARRTH